MCPYGYLMPSYDKEIGNGTKLVSRRHSAKDTSLTRYTYCAGFNRISMEWNTYSQINALTGKAPKWHAHSGHMVLMNELTNAFILIQSPDRWPLGSLSCGLFCSHKLWNQVPWLLSLTARKEVQTTLFDIFFFLAFRPNWNRACGALPQLLTESIRRIHWKAMFSQLTTVS